MGNCAVAILAGGQSTRMGQDKSFVLLNGKPLIGHVIERLSVLSLPIILITNQSDKYRHLNLPIFGDLLNERSSLGGLYAALHHSSAEFTFCAACDMPFLNPALIEALFQCSDGFDAVVPRIDGHPQGLHAVYRNGCIPTIEAQINQQNLRIRDLFGHLNTCWQSEAWLRQYDPELQSFLNINTPEALQAASSKINS